MRLRKNLPALPIIDAIINRKIFTLNAPPVIVNTLYGIGVKPAVNIIQKFHSSYKFFYFDKIVLE